VKIKTDLEWKEMLRSSLDEAVKKRLVSDVPLGVFLSGGTDSSLITAIAKEHKTGPLKTFSIGFKENHFDEHVYASQVASHLKTEHHEHILYESEAASILEIYLKHLDEPFADTSTIPTMLVSQMAKKQVSVALTGDGGDELFLGYGSYAWARRLRNPLFGLFKPALAPTLKMFGNSRHKRIARILENVDRKHLRSHIFSQEQYFFSDSEIRKKLLKSTLDYESFLYSDPVVFESQTEEEKQAIFDLKYYLKDDLLVKVDRSSMFYGLECRCPLLDQQVLRIALNAPLQLKRKDGVNKWILKHLLSDYLPESLVNRPKWGFSVPLSRWLKNDLRYLVTEYLSREVVINAGIVNFEYVDDLWKAFIAGNEFLYHRIWILVVLHKWIKDNG
jgi:asparagine synthase (glutamine-hydrolysing)